MIDRFVVAAGDLTDPALVPFAWTVRDPNGDTLTCRLDADGDGSWDEVIAPCPATGGRNTDAGQGSATARFEVSDADHPPVSATADYTVGPGPTEPYDIDARLATAPDARVAAAIDEAAARWSAVISRGVPDAEVHAPSGCTGGAFPEVPAFDGVVDDVVVEVIVVAETGGFMGDAAPCVLGPDGLPRLSVVRLDADWITWMYDHGQLGDLVAHEMGHALGFSGGTWWQYRYDAGLPAGWRFRGPRSVAEWSRLGGTSDVPLNDGSDHWDETILQNELMTCAIEYTPEHPLSALTVAAMADSGYHVDLGAAEPWTLPPEPGYMTC